MGKTKTVFLLSGCTKYCVKQIGKELKKKTLREDLENRQEPATY